MTALPLVTEIKRGSLDDGPGIRSTVFFKGCALDCIWCHNPETVSSAPELFVASNACLGTVCRACTDACRLARIGCHSSADCSACGDCAERCPTGARRLIGRHWPLASLLALLLEDLDFYRASGGGVTLSGGEPTMHHAYASELLHGLKKEGVHTVIQTCGLFHLDLLRRDLLPHLDLVFFDLKLIDPVAHRNYTGADNKAILANFSALAEEIGPRLIPRVPLVPGITDGEANLTAIADLVRQARCADWELLPYHPGGIGKRRNLGLEVPPELAVTPLSAEEERRCREFFRGRTLCGPDISDC